MSFTAGYTVARTVATPSSSNSERHGSVADRHLVNGGFYELMGRKFFFVINPSEDTLNAYTEHEGMTPRKIDIEHKINEEWTKKLTIQAIGNQ